MLHLKPEWEMIGETKRQNKEAEDKKSDHVSLGKERDKKRP